MDNGRIWDEQWKLEVKGGSTGVRESWDWVCGGTGKASGVR